MGRVFWFGPFVAAAEWEEVASALYERCTGVLAPTVSQEEMAIDVRFDRFERWATTLGFAAEEGSSALILETVLGGPGRVIRPVADDDLIRWRTATAYGSDDVDLVTEDVVAYLEWRQRFAQGQTRGG